MEKIIETCWNELWPLINVLNEICHGINISNLEQVVGFKYDTILALLTKLETYDVKEIDSDNKTILKLDESEKEIIKNCFRIIFKEIEEWEFSTRIGISTHEANALKNKFLE